MKLWIVAIAAFVLSVGQARAEDHADGIYDGRAIPGWSYYAEGGGSRWVASDGWSVTAHALCSLAQGPGIASLQVWRSHVPTSAEALAAAIGANSPGRTVHAGSQLQELVVAGHPAFRFQLRTTDEYGEHLVVMWVIAGVEAELDFTCTTRDEYSAEALPRFEAFASGMGVLTTAPQ